MEAFIEYLRYAGYVYKGHLKEHSQQIHDVVPFQFTEKDTGTSEEERVSEQGVITVERKAGSWLCPEGGRA